MSLLDANADSLALAADNTFRAPAAPAQRGAFDNFGSSAGNYFMRSMAEGGRAASMAVAALPVLADMAISRDSVLGEALGDKSLSDRYFEWHDETFGRAVDYWTPKPQEVGTAGQIVGQLSGSIVKFLASPALSIADAQLTTAENLVRQGVGAGTAQAAGAIAGTAQAVGIRLPAAIGNTLGTRLASGAGGNVLQSTVATEAQRLALQAGDAPQKVVDQFDPLDPKARGIDALMGLVFGAKAHFDARFDSLTPTQRDAILLVNQARHIEDNSLPGRALTAADQTRAVDGTRQAMDQMLRGEPVAVDSPLPGFELDPARAELAAVIEAELPKVDPVQVPRMAEPEGTKLAEPGAEPAAPRFDESVRLPSGEFDPATGQERAMSANDFIARANADAAQAKATAPGLLQTAAECLLGGL